MSAPCERFERDHLAGLLASELGSAGGHDVRNSDDELELHIASCADCRSHRAAYERIARGLAGLGTGAERRSDHVARVLAAAAQPPASAWPGRALVRVAPAVVLAAAALLAIWWRTGAVPEPPRFTIALVASDRQAVRGDGRLGDRLQVAAPAGTALWIYRNDSELLRACPRDCARAGDRLTTELVLDSVGRYHVVWLSTDRLPAPAGVLERDIAAARAAGASHELREVEVH